METPEPVPTKRCTKCGGVKPLEVFYAAKGRKSGRGSWCKDCAAEDRRRRVAADPAAAADTLFRKKYKSSYEQFRLIFQSQGERCAGCLRERKVGEKQFSLDHAHEHTDSGDIGLSRGVLCFSCNHTLGNARDSAASLYRLGRYVEDYAATHAELTGGELHYQI